VTLIGNVKGVFISVTGIGTVMFRVCLFFFVWFIFVFQNVIVTGNSSKACYGFAILSGGASLVSINSTFHNLDIKGESIIYVSGNAFITLNELSFTNITSEGSSGVVFTSAIDIVFVLSFKNSNITNVTYSTEVGGLISIVGPTENVIFGPDISGLFLHYFDFFCVLFV
jgi:hypothetical protein